MIKYFLNIASFNFLLFTLYLVYGFPSNVFFGITNYFIIIISLLAIFSKPNEYYSLFKFFFLFSLIFFGLIPYLDFINKVYYWEGSALDTEYFIVSNVIILLAISLYWILYYTYNPKININKILNKNKILSIYIKYNKGKVLMSLLMVSLLSAFIIFYYRDFNFLNLFFRDALQVTTKIELLFVSYFITPIPILVVLLVSYINKSIEYRYKGVYTMLVLIIAFLFVFPTSTARFFAISMYLSIILSYTKILNKRYRIQYSLLFGLFVIFPLMDKFRFIANADKITWSFDFHFLQAGHFSGYQNFVRLISIDYISYGYQLYGALAFFIPRSIWDSKPIGSGHLVARMSEMDFTNISLPLIAEGYINFGIIGSLLFMGLFGILSKYCDTYYWKLKNESTNNIYYPLYYLFIGLSLFILRGDLMSSFAYSITIIGVYVLLSKLIKFVVYNKIIFKMSNNE